MTDSNRVLLIIDPLKDFCPGGALPAPGGDAIMPIINRLMHSGPYDAIVLVNETHPPDHISFASRHGEKPFTEKKLEEGWTQMLWPDHCVEGTGGAEPHEALDRDPVTHVFRKGQEKDVESYSAFRNVHGKETGLKDLLREAGVEAIDVVGIATDYCVKESVLDACDPQMGFTVRVVIDACAGIGASPEDVPNAVQQMQNAGAAIIESKDLV